MMSRQKLQTISDKVVFCAQKIFADKMDKVLLYGSYARGDYTDDSDIDIMIILDCPKEEVAAYRRKTSQMASRIGLEYDVLISIILRDKETFDSRKEELLFYQNVVKDGIKLYVKSREDEVK